MQPVPHPWILEIEPYVPGQSSLKGVDRVIKLSSNEGALGPSPLAIEAFKSAVSKLHRYPDGASQSLRAAIARRWGLEAERIVCGTGSDELIVLMARAYAGPDTEVIQTRHGFLMYSTAALAAGAKPIFVPERNLTADVDAILAAVTPKTRLVYLANPNNPTGTYLPETEIRRLHAGLRGDIILVLDSAYSEFVTNADYEPGVALARDTANVVMLRTFSKIFGLGSMRVGWGYAGPDIIDVLNRTRGAFSLSTAGQLAAEAALGDRAFFERSVAHNEKWRNWLTNELRALGNGITVVPSVCNFVLVRFRDAAGADAADAWLKSRGIIVRKMGAYGLPDSLRITIGMPEEMQAVVTSLKELVSAA